MEIITCHIYADLDALSSMVLAQKKYPSAIMVFPGNIGKNVKAFINLHQDMLNIKKLKEINLEKVTKLIVVDTAKYNRIGNLSKLFEINKNLNKNLKVVIYDHHKDSKYDIKNILEENNIKKSNFEIVKNNYGSNTTNILEILLKEKNLENKDLELSEIEATIAMMGLYEDTGNFTFASTTPTDLKMGGYLLEQKAKLSMVKEYVQKGLDKDQLEVFIDLLENEEILEVEGQKILLTYYKSSEFILGLDEVINKIQFLRKASIVVIICGDKKKSVIIGRSSKKLNIGEILEEYYVEGHEYAVSGILKDIKIEKLVKDVKQTLIRNIKPKKKAKDIMNSPVKTISKTTKIKSAYQTMYRMEYDGLPIVEDGNIIGIITRSSIDKALNHGFANAPVSAYMTSEIITGNTEMAVEELKALIVENEIGRIPILNNRKEIVGIVTRKDVLESIYDKNIIHKKEKRKVQVEMKKKIEKKIPKELMTLLKKIEIVSKNRDERSFLVGGIVRDLVLGINNKDIDIVVEGDSIEFAKELKEILKAQKIIIHEKFRTAVLIVDENLKLDIAGSRLEYYEYPTSLPIVEYGNIKDDMYRRDFTINAMALEIDNLNFGKLLDFYNGKEDLKNKKIRVLHNLSFVEDPTRIIRAFRFAARYDFTLGKDTEKFLENAIEDGFLSKVSWPRVKQEIEILFSDRNIETALDYMEKYKVFKEIHRNINYSPTIRKNIEKVKQEKVIKLINELKTPKWLIVFLVILENLNMEELDLVFQKFDFSRKFKDKYDYGISRRNDIIKDLKSSEKNSEIYKILKNISYEIIILIYIQSNCDKIVTKIEKYIYSLRNIKNIVTGKDLLEKGEKSGKEFKEKIEYYFLKQLDMNNPTKEKLLK